MKYTILLNQTKAIEWELNLTQATLFAYLIDLPSWAEQFIVGNEIYYWSSRNKVINELPILTDKEDTVYRLMKQLEEKGLIVLKKNGNKDFIKLTKKCKDWITEKNPDSEINPFELGNISENNSEKNPTYKKIINNSEITILNKKKKFLRKIFDWQEKNPEKYPKRMYVDFVKYWTETNKDGKPLIRYDSEKYFAVGKRLHSWFGIAGDSKIASYWEVENKIASLGELFTNYLNEK